MQRLTMVGAVFAAVLGLATVALASSGNCTCFNTNNCGSKGSLTNCYICCGNCNTQVDCQDCCDDVVWP